MSKEYKDLVVGLDIGTSKVTCLVVEAFPDGQFEVNLAEAVPTKTGPGTGPGGRPQGR